MIDILAKGLFGLSPVLVYLVALVIMDSYKLVKLRSVVLAVLAGCVALLGCKYLNAFLMDLTQLQLASFSRYVAPFTEESAKAAYLVFLIRRKHIGFMVDAAIYGFAAGAGFGILENIFYLSLIPEAKLFTWVLRGCGTALMHGSTTAIFGVVFQQWCERDGNIRLRNLLPGLGLAILLHSAYNHFFISPVMTAVGLVLGVPLITLAVYQQSEKSLERWLGLGFDTDAEMLAIINAGKVSTTRVGAYLVSLRERFPPEVVADMFCFLRIQVELAIQAKGILLMRKEGFDAQPGPDVPEKLAELKYLERSIGRTGRLAIMPFLQRSRKDHWQKHLLK